MAYCEQELTRNDILKLKLQSGETEGHSDLYLSMNASLLFWISCQIQQADSALCFYISNHEERLLHGMHLCILIVLYMIV
ncbi:hypothetical protein XELAEV_18011992mg [Xenopus laevis]|uniref:Uncharacterized protein n=1 Tax=Xenopus laevis TaxID=8355 RepID=A0A974HXU7_XENLA|nr:hypothetical protein XELAEV_18011992mg [Xenopus laevis]